MVEQLDPNPIVSGQGIKKLRDHGIHVLIGVLEEEDIDVYGVPGPLKSSL